MVLRILVADDHIAVRHGLRQLLETEPGWRVEDEATDGREAVEKAKHVKPDIVLLDISMAEELDGLDASRKIRNILPETEVLIVTQHRSQQVLREAVNAGARGYLLKSDAARELIRAVEAVGRHEPFLSSSMAFITSRADRG